MLRNIWAFLLSAKFRPKDKNDGFSAMTLKEFTLKPKGKFYMADSMTNKRQHSL
jgi:hypothetical protein